MKRVAPILWTLFGVGFIGAVCVTVLGEKGLLDLHRLKAAHTRLEAENHRLTEETKDLYREVDRLKHDRKYIESIARQELGLVGENEIILRSQ